jgi:hypothetical protein
MPELEVDTSEKIRQKLCCLNLIKVYRTAVSPSAVYVSLREGYELCLRVEY